MKRMFFKKILAFYFIFSVGLLAEGSQKKYHIIVDPGHGGSDRGAVNGSLKESHIALTVSNQLKELLQNDSKFRVSMTRSNDQSIGLNDRCQFAKIKNGDLFVSIHVNSATSPSARGAQFYFQNELPPDEEAMFLAHRENHEHQYELNKEEESVFNSTTSNILEDLQRYHHARMSAKFAYDLKETWQLGLNSKRVEIKRGPFRVLLGVNMPSVLVELGFITHPEESRWLSELGTQKKMARVIYEGIQKFTERMDKYQQPRHITTHAY